MTWKRFWEEAAVNVALGAFVDELNLALAFEGSHLDFADLDKFEAEPLL